MISNSPRQMAINAELLRVSHQYDLSINMFNSALKILKLLGNNKDLEFWVESHLAVAMFEKEQKEGWDLKDFDFDRPIKKFKQIEKKRGGSKESRAWAKAQYAELLRTLAIKPLFWPHDLHTSIAHLRKSIEYFKKAKVPQKSWVIVHCQAAKILLSTLDLLTENPHIKSVEMKAFVDVLKNNMRGGYFWGEYWLSAVDIINTFIKALKSPDEYLVNKDMFIALYCNSLPTFINACKNSPELIGDSVEPYISMNSAAFFFILILLSSSGILNKNKPGHGLIEFWTKNAIAMLSELEGSRFSLDSTQNINLQLILFSTEININSEGALDMLDKKFNNWHKHFLNVICGLSYLYDSIKSINRDFIAIEPLLGTNNLAELKIVIETERISSVLLMFGIFRLWLKRPNKKLTPKLLCALIYFKNILIFRHEIHKTPIGKDMWRY